MNVTDDFHATNNLRIIYWEKVFQSSMEAFLKEDILKILNRFSSSDTEFHVLKH